LNLLWLIKNENRFIKKREKLS